MSKPETSESEMSERAPEDPLGDWKDEASRRRYMELYRTLQAESWNDLAAAGATIPIEHDLAGSFGLTKVFQWPGDGVPVVLLHGAQSNELMWSRLIGELDPGSALYTPDIPGDPGPSVQTAAVADVGGLVAWLDETLAALQLDRVHLAGCSYGGWLALHYSAALPDRVQSLTLVEPVIQKLRPKFFVHGIGAGLAMAIPGPQRRPLGRRLDVELLATDPRQRTLGSLAFTKHRRRGLPRFSPVDDQIIADLNVPTLVILGERSPVHRSHRLAVRMQELNQNIRVELVPRAGHTVAVEHPETVATLMQS